MENIRVDTSLGEKLLKGLATSFFKKSGKNNFFTYNKDEQAARPLQDQQDIPQEYRPNAGDPTETHGCRADRP